MASIEAILDEFDAIALLPSEMVSMEAILAGYDATESLLRKEEMRRRENMDDRHFLFESVDDGAVSPSTTPRDCLTNRLKRLKARTEESDNRIIWISLVRTMGARFYRRKKRLAEVSPIETQDNEMASEVLHHASDVMEVEVEENGKSIVAKEEVRALWYMYKMTHEFREISIDCINKEKALLPAEPQTWEDVIVRRALLRAARWHLMALQVLVAILWSIHRQGLKIEECFDNLGIVGIESIEVELEDGTDAEPGNEADGSANNGTNDGPETSADDTLMENAEAAGDAASPPRFLFGVRQNRRGWETLMRVAKIVEEKEAAAEIKEWRRQTSITDFLHRRDTVEEKRAAETQPESTFETKEFGGQKSITDFFSRLDITKS